MVDNVPQFMVAVRDLGDLLTLTNYRDDMQRKKPLASGVKKALHQLQYALASPKFCENFLTLSFTHRSYVNFAEDCGNVQSGLLIRR